jgi:hypothetical protein
MAIIELSNTQIFIYGTLWAGFWAVVGWFANFGVSAYRLHVARQHALEDAQENRRRKFLGFLSPWAADVEANRPMTNESNVSQTVAQRFDKKRLKFITEVAQIEPDFLDNKSIKFDRLVAIIVNMTPGQIDEGDGRKKLLEAIRDLAAFVKAK